ncbi:MAG: hypothetical protein QNI91_16885 [Arenicellales bacterium]|nr:hypothetical protein [Arenicellales bacterium]
MNTFLRKSRIITSVFLLAFISIEIFASEAEQEGADHSFEHHGKHNLGLFLGITREEEHGEKHNRETIGIEYSYRINRYWSAGAVVERAERDKDSTLAVAFVHFWPTEFLYLGLGVGRKDPGEEREVTYRGTIGYEFELGKGWSISPQANIDVIEDEDNEEVYGLVIAKRF